MYSIYVNGITYKYVVNVCYNNMLISMQVFRIAYCLPFSDSKQHSYQLHCEEFLKVAKEFQPELLQKRKVHLLLHLVECMNDFGPTAGFNTER